MKKWLILLPACLLLTGCAALLERSYSVVEPYSDRYWDSAAEDTLRAENHQDLVNSLLLLVDQRAEEGVIRCYGPANSYIQAQLACREVARDTALGAYLLDDLTFSYENGAGFCSVTCRMVYREGTEDPGSIMPLSDSQSLVDLLRLAVREEHEKLTARFPRNVPREELSAAVESLWQELCQSEDTAEASALVPPEDAAPDNGDGLEEREQAVEANAQAVPSPAPPEVPPCPWTIHFYPDAPAPEIVEVLLS